MTSFEVETGLLTQLQEWFLSECNGDWEHTYGFKLETLDNPGWTFEADLSETDWAGVEMPRERINRSETDWVQYEVAENRFIACGGPKNLIEMLQGFFSILEKLRPHRLVD